MKTMPVNFMTEVITSSVQWAWIMTIGFFASTQFNYQDDLHKIAITAISMTVGTIVSFVVKVQLNKVRRCINSNYSGSFLKYFKSKFRL